MQARFLSEDATQIAALKEAGFSLDSCAVNCGLTIAKARELIVQDAAKAALVKEIRADMRALRVAERNTVRIGGALV